ncbi:MAG TPA: type II toxin-antitoxin system VapC family toxin [Mycobacteriales bacterium]|nr:type II toxin-antitoxin system VapC family toxin [Mycobacteriales bacterium]
MIVVDASVLTNALTDDGPIGQLSRSSLAEDPQWTGPEHLIVETFSAIRGRLLGRKISEQRAREAIEAIAGVEIGMLPVVRLLPRMWELRNAIGGSDAAYVASAEIDECALLTADVRLARAAESYCDVHLCLP